MYPAIFLDRDGTINEDRGYICNLNELVFIPKAFEALHLLQKHFILFIITNQSGIGKNIFTEQQFLKFNREYLRILKNEGIEICEVYYCPHTRDDNCECHKPSKYFIEKAQAKYDILLEKSFVIGDHPSDVEMAYNAKTKSIYLLSGHGQKHRKELVNMPNFIAEDLYQAAHYIKKQII